MRNCGRLRSHADSPGMSVFGSSPITPNSAQSLAGLNQAERANKANSEAKKTTKPDGRRREPDAVELDVQNAQAADAIRNLKSNGDEETTDDRKGEQKYEKDKGEKKAGERPKLDIQG